MSKKKCPSKTLEEKKELVEKIESIALQGGISGREAALSMGITANAYYSMKTWIKKSGHSRIKPKPSLSIIPVSSPDSPSSRILVFYGTPEMISQAVKELL